MQKLVNYLQNYENIYSCIYPLNLALVPLLLGVYSYFFTFNSFIEFVIVAAIPNLLLLIVFYSFSLLKDKIIFKNHIPVSDLQIDCSKYSNVVPFKKRTDNESKVR